MASLVLIAGCLAAAELSADRARSNGVLELHSRGDTDTPEHRQKIGPNLAAMIAEGTVTDTTTLDVMIGLDRHADAAVLEGLSAHGFEVGTAAGDVLTGRIPMNGLSELAADARVLMIESGGALGPETFQPGGGPPTE